MQQTNSHQRFAFVLQHCLHYSMACLICSKNNSCSLAKKPQDILPVSRGRRAILIICPCVQGWERPIFYIPATNCSKHCSKSDYSWLDISNLCLFEENPYVFNHVTTGLGCLRLFFQRSPKTLTHIQQKAKACSGDQVYRSFRWGTSYMRSPPSWDYLLP